MKRLTLLITIVVWSLLPAAADAQNSDADRLHAVLISGGRNRLTNHERYWNDCAFLYRTLRKTYHVPQRNITVLMSDGGDADRDMIKADASGFVSSPIDLDGDGWPDINGEATREVVMSTLSRLALRLTTDDRLFLFITDHGGSDDQLADSYLWLWNDELLYDHTLATLLTLFQVGSISILMGQCYSGGFMDDLMSYDRIVTTSCRGDERSWACHDRPYDEFIYHWICAVNGADENDNAVNADSDGDGEVSMAEAFSYARSNDRRPETPQFDSWPVELAQWWSFGKLLSVGVSAVSNKPDREQNPTAVWSVTGIRKSPQSVERAVYLQRHNGKIRKIVR